MRIRAILLAKLGPVPALRAAMDAVERGEADVALGEEEAFAPLLAEAGGKLEIVRGNVKVHPGVAMALRADDIDLRFAFEDLIHDSRKTEAFTARRRHGSARPRRNGDRQTGRHSAVSSRGNGQTGRGAAFPALIPASLIH